MMNTLRGIMKLAAYGLLCIVGILLQALLMAVYKGPATYVLPQLFHKISCKIFNLRCTVMGRPLLDEHVLFVGNHLSYLDIPAIGAIVPGSFAAKKEVAGWPLFGTLARLQQTIFLDRARQKAKDGGSDIAQAIRDGKTLILFPEGTSSDGRTVLPFKSSLFSSFMDGTDGRNIVLQPFTLRLVKVDGRPVDDDQATRDLYAWHNGIDLDLAPHLWNFSRLGGAELVLTFHPPRRAAAYTDRKALALDCHADVLSGLNPAAGLDFQTKAA